MPDIATPNLPSRNFDVTRDFYAQFGFECAFQDGGWMILHRGPPKSRVTLEFFPYPDLDPAQSSFSCCIRLDNLRAFMEQLEASDVPLANTGIPRFHAAKLEHSGLTIGYLNDIDGSLIRLIQNT